VGAGLPGDADDGGQRVHNCRVVRDVGLVPFVRDRGERGDRVMRLRRRGGAVDAAHSSLAVPLAAGAAGVRHLCLLRVALERAARWWRCPSRGGHPPYMLPEIKG
jgi:hypothetical protein